MIRNTIKTKSDSKLFSSMGPWHIYMKLALLTFYTPHWRKVCRMLCQMRRMNRLDFSGEGRHKCIKYARQSFKDTRLPDLIKWVLRDCIREEFNFEVDPY